MDDVSALSPASSIDCFSDAEIDVYEPPTNSKGNKRIDDKPDDLSCKENGESNLHSSEPESRDVTADVLIEETLLATSREDLQSDSHINMSAEPVDSVHNETIKPDNGGMEPTVELHPQQNTAIPYLTTGSSEALNKLSGKSFESTNWPIDSSKVMLVNNSNDEAMDLNDDISNANSSKPLGRSDDVGLLKKPTVSFADDKSSSENGVISRSGSGVSSKKSVQSRKSIFSILKSKSKDVSDKESIKPSLSKSSKAEKTVQSVTSNSADSVATDKKDSTPDITIAPEPMVKDVPLSTEESVASKSTRGGKSSARSIRSTNEGKSVSVGTIDKSTTPDVSIVPESLVESVPLEPQRSVTSKNSKGFKSSARSVSSKKEDKSVSNKTSKSLQGNLNEDDVSAPSPVSSPRLYGPPQRLPRWGGIPKPGKSVASDKNSVAKSAKQDDVHSTPMKEEPGDKLLHSDATVKSEKTKASLIDLSQTLAKEEIENIVSPTLNLAEPPKTMTPSLSKELDDGNVDEDNAQDDDDNGPALDATSTLSSKSSKQDEVDPIVESSHSKECAVDNKDVYESEEVHVSEIPVIPDDDAVQLIETDFINKTDENLVVNTQSLQVEVNNIENDPIKAVMEPFSPIEVPNCATIEDTILKNVSPTCFSSEDIEPGNECHKAKSFDKAEVSTMEVSTMEVIQPKKVVKSKFWSFGRTKLSNELIPIDEHKPLKVETTPINPGENSTSAGQPNKPSILTKVLSSKIGSALLSPKKAAVADSETSIEVEMIKSNSPRKDSNQLNFGMFKRSSLISPTKKTSGVKSFENSLKQKTDIDVPNDDDDTDVSMIPFATIPVDESTVDAVAPPLEHDVAIRDIANANVGATDQQYNNIGMNTGPKHIGNNFMKNPQVLKVKQKPSTRFFGKKRDSNEKKRYLAKMSQEKINKVEKKRKEHQVKLSAMIDDKVLVEDLHVNHSESPTKLTLPATYDKVSSLSNKLDDSATPIIVVDHRSTKKIEAIGKFESKSTSSCIRPTALNLKSESVNSAVADDQLYTSDDTVTETELTEVAKLDVPCETDHVPIIPENVIVDENKLDGEISDKDHLNDSKKMNDEPSSKDEPSWITTFVDWCTPKSSTDIKNWIDCGMLPNNTKDKEILPEKSKQCNNEALDEAIVNFRECNDFYAETLNLKGNSVNKLSTANENYSSVNDEEPHQDWSTQLMEWISPKSKQIISNSKAVTGAIPVAEIIPDITPTQDIVQPIESHGTLQHEGTEIALTNFESPVGKRQKSPYRGYLATKTMFGKSLRKHFGRVKRSKPMKSTSALSDSKLSLGISETKLEKTSQETKEGRIPFRKLFRTEVAEAKAEENVPIIEKRFLKSKLPNVTKVPVPETSEQVHIDDVTEANAEENVLITDKRVVKSKLPIAADIHDVPATAVPVIHDIPVTAAPAHVEPPSSTLFTFTSDDTGTDELPIADTKSSTQKGCCESNNIVNRMIGHVDEDNIASEQLKENAVDEDVEESVKYLAIVKGKRQARRQRNDESVVNTIEAETEYPETSKNLATTKPTKTTGNKLDHDNKDMEFQYRVCAVSDEAVEEIKSNGSEASSSMKFASFVSSKEERQGKDSAYLSYDESLERVEGPAPNETNYKRTSSKKLFWGKKAIPTRSANRGSRRKEDDSVGVSFNSGNNSFDDDLSVAFAPGVGKWLW